MAKVTIARLKITLNDVEPLVFRRIEVPLALRLDRLHVALQLAFGWSDSHLHEFRAGRTRWGEPDLDWDFDDGPRDERENTLDHLLTEAGREQIEYAYDFGDGWTHTIKIEKRIEAEPDKTYPRLVEASGACPPEDVGGPFGYADFLDAIADPKHERHEELLVWCGGAFDPARVDSEAIALMLGRLATAWSRMPRVRVKKRVS